MIRDYDLNELANKTTGEIFQALDSSRKGLSSAEAARRLKVYGPNEFRAERKIKPLLIFLSKFKSPLLIMLVAAAVIEGFLGSPIDSLVILAVVLISTLIDFFNTYKSGLAAVRLRERVNITSAVLRSGEMKERKIAEMVPGDVFALTAGDLVPADSVLVEARDLFLNESVLTGESLPAEKTAESPEARTLLMGTSVVSGKGLAAAVMTGEKTRIGGIAKRIVGTEPLTEFDKNVKEFSLFIFRVTLFLVLAILLLNIFFGRKSPLQIFLFAVAIAVGVTPELLPMIITANLGKGALKMSRDGVIVKKLSAIHNFGSVDVICTDKTGTLTEDKITLVKYVDGFGEECEEVLFWGYLGSVNLTGVRGVIEEAVQNVKKIDVGDWKKIDELPFDHDRKRDSVVVSRGDKTILITKGAPEEIFKISEFYGEKGSELNAVLRDKIENEYQKLSKDGFRVLGLARKDVPKRQALYSKTDENGMNFTGFLAFLDPPKKTVKETLEKMAAHNVDIKIITGDNALVTEKVARDINLKVKGVLTGEDLSGLDELSLRKKVEEANLFTRVGPEQKQMIIRALRANGHVVGYLGDGVNDALSLKEADVGISVENAVDIAKDTADIILLRKGLNAVISGIVEGRKTFANTFKYLMMALSSNFGNMFSMPAASLFINFLPMTPSQILLNNFLYDSSQLAIPFDNVDGEFLTRPKKFDVGFMKKFMVIFGPLSSAFDVITFLVLYFLFGLSGSGFQSGWFLESIATQTLVVLVIRSKKDIFQSRPSVALVFAAATVVLLGWLIPQTAIGRIFGFIKLSGAVIAANAAIVISYLFVIEFVKKRFYGRYGGLIEK